MAFEPEIAAAIARKAQEMDWPEQAFAAIVEVESKGKAHTEVNGRRLPLILYEYHVFHRRLPQGLRAEAIRRNLARPKWGDLPYKKTQSARYAQLDRAKAMHSEAAYMACSWGVGQVLGENAEWLGFASAQALAERATEGIDGQLDLMARFIVKRGLEDELRRGDWRGFARAYNGSGQVDHYAGLMARAHRRLGGALPEAGMDDDVILRVGAAGLGVNQLQLNLRRLGYHLHVDGDFGTATKMAVAKFQNDHGLGVDGIAGAGTLGRIEALLGRDATAFV